MSDLKKITTMAEEMLKLEDRIARGEEFLKQLKTLHRQLSESDIPEAMESAGVEEFSLSDGRKIQLDDKLYVSISSERSEEAFRWLKENNYGDIIKRTLTVSFPKDQEKHSRHLFRYLTARKYLSDASIVSDEKVHPSTLKAFVRTALENGEDLPMDAFGVHQIRVAKVMTTKARRKKS